MVRTGYVYDEQMLAHRDLCSDDHPEQPERLVSIKARLMDAGLLEEAVYIPMDLEDMAAITMVHSAAHHDTMMKTSRTAGWRAASD